MNADKIELFLKELMTDVAKNVLHLNFNQGVDIKELYSVKIIDEIDKNLVENYSKEEWFSDIVKRIIFYNYVFITNETIKSYLENNNDQVIVNRFINDNLFAKILLRNYYQVYFEIKFRSWGEDKSEQFMEQDLMSKPDLLRRWTNVSFKYVGTLNDKWRKLVRNLDDVVVSKGGTINETVQLLKAILILNKDVDGLVSREFNNTKDFYRMRKYFIALIYADLYEANIKQQIAKNDMMNNYINQVLANDHYLSLPKDNSYLNILLSEYIITCRDSKKIRMKTNDQTNEMIYQKIKKANPLYCFDGLA